MTRRHLPLAACAALVAGTLIAACDDNDTGTGTISAPGTLSIKIVRGVRT